MAKENKVTIKIPRKLYDNLGKITDDTGFNSVTDFIVYCLRDIVYEVKERDDKKLTEKDVNSVKKRLKSLGYLE
ncbi:CopG family transcriptional regulator [Patescibacteria group bacterium]|nr:CopG family transcriptional regulator [Patescibacteria group bacterium]MBU1673275.1 CopG family transcriptional regulator [Patescibacteria group bacterium]MBU1964083.1 CopG family transcriptional regulator [Patescibacteria group bacterium]